MELFRMAGLSSEDLMRPGQNSPKAFLGSMFKMAPASEAQVAALVEDGVLEPPAQSPADQKADDAPEDHRWSESSLKALTKDKLVVVASSLGVADLTGTKDKLVEAILSVQ